VNSKGPKRASHGGWQTAYRAHCCPFFGRCLSHVLMHSCTWLSLLSLSIMYPSLDPTLNLTHVISLINQNYYFLLLSLSLSLIIITFFLIILSSFTTNKTMLLLTNNKCLSLQPPYSSFLSHPTFKSFSIHLTIYIILSILIYLLLLYFFTVFFNNIRFWHCISLMLFLTLFNHLYYFS